MGAYEVVGRLMDALAPGSYLVLPQGSPMPGDNSITADVIRAYEGKGIRMAVRDERQIGRFFEGLELVDPDIVMAHRWKPGDERAEAEAVEQFILAGVGRKP
ncbi:SAM-dependent methyltransferase [Streptomyces sp. B1866]|uniref:SAM-dependent methyltransferase n=1 Tax=Streptomyces sp. B1866 TaxID=3075431 RepID=UPI00288D9189|nr:SAM-dependent methyltransferase [Streptomyces sp. B1866]MDT3398907.1 SAM-dependent methyltransferase [Streptomyces sp. B1866]